MAGLTDEGFEAKTYEDILAGIEAAQHASVLGADFDVSAESPAGVLNGIVANTARELWEGLAGLYAAFDRDGATGQALTQTAALTGTNRRGAQKGRVPLVLSVAAGATVPAGSVADVTESPSNRWVTLTAAVNTTDAQLAITVQAEQETAGPLPAAATAIDHIATPVAGWVSVTNIEPASPGLDAETDPELRRRAEIELQGAGTAPVEAIRAALSRVPLVSEVVVWENTGDTTVDGRPPHSVEAMVTGGADQAVMAALWAAKARGIATYGTYVPPVEVGTEVADAQGQAQTVRFTRPSDVNVWVALQVRAGPRLGPSNDAIKTAVRAAIAGLRAGEPVLRAVLNCAAMDVTGVANVLSVKIGLDFGAVYAADLEVTPRQRAVSPNNTYVAVERV